MKDISNKRTQPLDLSKEDNISYSPYTLDLTEKTKSDGQSKPQQDKRQMNFFEYMPAATAASHPDDEFGEKLEAWFGAARERAAGVWHRVVAAVAPLRMFWVVTGGVGLIMGLAIVAYLATHRNWTASVPFLSPAVTKQGDKNGVSAPGKGAGSNTPGATTMPAVGSETVAPAAGSGASAGSGGATGTAASGGSTTGSTATSGTASRSTGGTTGGTGSSTVGSGSGTTSGGSTSTSTSGSGGTTILQPPALPLSTPVPLPTVQPTNPLSPVTNKVL